LKFVKRLKWHPSISRISLEGWSACRRDIYLTTHNTYMRQTFLFPERFEAAIPESERPQTLSLHCSATGTGVEKNWLI
jgi:hypothetical protein